MNDLNSLNARWGEPIWSPVDVPAQGRDERTPAVLLIVAVIERSGVDLAYRSKADSAGVGKRTLN